MDARILILMADSGGGHRASAEALRSAFCERLGSSLRLTVVDLWSEEAPWPLSRVPHAYGRFASRAPRLWKMVYASGERPWVARRTLDLGWYWAGGRARAALERYRPTLVVSVHALLQDIALRVLSEWRRRDGKVVPLVTVVTDLASAHPLWFHRGAALCFVPTDEVRRLALRAGIRPDRVRQRGLPVRPAFAMGSTDKRAAKVHIGLEKDLPLVLLIGGGDGMGRLEQAAVKVAARLSGGRRCEDRPLGQLAVVCGRNRRLRERLACREWPVPATVTGYVDNLWDWMAASEFIITKAGPNTIMEACAAGLPLLLNGYIPGQEKQNVSYIVSEGAGAYGADPDQVAETAGSWIGPDRSKLDAMARRARAISRPDAAFRIVDDIIAYGTAEAG